MSRVSNFKLQKNAQFAFLSIVCVACSSCIEVVRTPAAPELKATKAIQEIHEAEACFHTTFGHFGSLSELLAAKDKCPASELMRHPPGDYRLEVNSSGQRYVIRMYPAQYGRLSRRSFYSDQTRISRQSFEPAIADVNSEELK